ncbi:RICIN domain-containing protein [Nonomuraea jabiensis]|uniref:Ricin B lectin domain-containing protein n=1 Tax=Nonomuraea jabiensis TaxID=882448 RepID=A0A7W9GE04_9ACTN|nr:RICIN domain-containing protein [Nonomuraea jabiensis]MBB5782089.1 hypothetical protein [Nonomuraea jabiensis]
MSSAIAFAAVRRVLALAVAATAGLVIAGTGVAHADPVYYKFTAKHSGKCLDVLHGSTLNVTPTHQWTCLDRVLSQQWEARQFDDKSYVFVARHSGKCLDVAFASDIQGAAVIQQRCTFKPNQRWWVKKNNDGTYRVFAKHSRLCLDVANVDTANGARVVQARCWGGANQSWYITKIA